MTGTADTNPWRVAANLILGDPAEADSLLYLYDEAKTDDRIPLPWVRRALRRWRRA